MSRSQDIPGRSQEADHSAIAELQHRMEKLLTELDQSAQPFASAKQVVEFTGDRKKTALGEAFTTILTTDPECSATAAEHRARASLGYKERMKAIMADHLKAETAIAHFDILKTRLDIARSLLAVERAKLDRL